MRSTEIPLDEALEDEAPLIECALNLSDEIPLLSNKILNHL
jgi:hypothetical protein